VSAQPNRPKLTEYERECLIERAAIIEFDGNMPRDEAERLAWRDLDRQKTNQLLRGFSGLKHSA
jgi:hypothetical protein